MNLARIPRTHILLAGLSTLLAVPMAHAQRLVGGAVTPAGGPLVQAQPYCAPAVLVCAPVLGPIPVPFAGGTAYDPIHEVIWDTDGFMLVGLRATSTAPCAVWCAPAPAPVAAGVATGLAFDETRKSLLLLDSSPFLTQLTFPAGARCPVVANRCGLAGVFPATHQPGGLAFSERNDLVYYSASNFGGGAPMNLLFVAAAAAPCVPLCAVPLPNCAGAALGPITGLAFDDCINALFATDGNTTIRIRMAPPCVILAFDCCPAPVLGQYYGLDLEPEHTTPRGSTCVAGTCAACPGVGLSTIGDPSLGNGEFKLRVGNGVPGSLAFFFLGTGPCTPGVPFLCGTFHPALAPILLGSSVLAGGGACSGVTDFNLPIPMNGALCGNGVCIQAVLVCPPASLSLTNAVGLQFSDT
jgi:hypothetical protein